MPTAEQAEHPGLHSAPWFRMRPSTRAGIRLVFETNRPLARALLAVAAFAGLLPTLFTLAGGWLVGAAERGDPLLWPLVTVALLFLVGEVTENVAEAVIEGFREQVEARRRERVMAAMLEPPGLSHIEDGEVLDLVRQGANNEWPNTSAFTMGLFGLTRIRVAAFTSALLVARFRWWLAAGLIVLWIVCGHEMRRNQADSWLDTRGRLRRASYLRDLAFEPVAAKEVRVFGLGGWLLEGFSAAWHDVMRDVWRRRRGARIRQAIVFISVVAAHAAVFLLLVAAARRGELGPSELVVVLPATLALAQFGQTNQYTIAMSLGTVALPAVAELEERLASDPRLRLPGTAPASGLPRREIRFEGIAFSYPSRDQPLFSGLDLTIPAGRSLAIVGSNGAGKTTLVKLLARLYEPTGGGITVDGIDLRELDPRSWQAQVAAIFQDFVQYPMSAADNVAFGSPDQPRDIERLRSAAERVGALPLIESLPSGWDTVLSRRFAGGTDLSGGQWQRLALARALYAVEGGATVLVLDEPTANLDVRSEVELFDRFLEVTRGVTTILISHRFSTVRRADRIVVLEGGRVCEEGSHAELLAAGGRYATAFRLQADRYVDEVVRDG